MAFRPQLQEYRSVGDPLNSSDWFLLIPTIPGAQDARKMSFKVVSTVLPGRSIEQMALEIGARKFNFAGKPVFSGTWTSTIIETSDASTRSDILGWMELARPYASGAGTFRATYGQTAELRVYDAANNVAISSTIHALFPLSVDDANLDQSSTVLQYTVNWSYDSVTEATGGAE